MKTRKIISILALILLISVSSIQVQASHKLSKKDFSYGYLNSKTSNDYFNFIDWCGDRDMVVPMDSKNDSDYKSQRGITFGASVKKVTKTYGARKLKVYKHNDYIHKIYNKGSRNDLPMVKSSKYYISYVLKNKKNKYEMKLFFNKSKKLVAVVYAKR